MNTPRPDTRLFPTLALVVWPVPTQPVKLAASDASLRPSPFPALASVRWDGASRASA